MGLKMPCDLCQDPESCALLGCVFKQHVDKKYSNEMDYLGEDDIDLSDDVKNGKLIDE
jgi:hypothetical protein